MSESTPPASSASPIWLRYVFVVAAIAGAVACWTFNVLAFMEIGWGYTPRAFVMAGFSGGPLLGSVAADFWIGSMASMFFMYFEHRRLGMAKFWAYAVATLAIAWAFALPWFLYRRELRLDGLDRCA